MSKETVKRPLLLFECDDMCLGVDHERITEIIPWVDLESLDNVPPYVAGSMSYHGWPVPVVDMSRLLLGRPAERLLSTRIIIVKPLDEALVGVIAEKAVSMAEIPVVASAGKEASDRHACLAETLEHENHSISVVNVDKILPAGMVETLQKQAS